MRLEVGHPTMLYDDYCGVCSSLARLAAKWSGAWIRILGHSTTEATRMKKDFFADADHPEKLFWLIRGDVAYGGRSGVIPLLAEIVRGRLVGG